MAKVSPPVRFSKKFNVSKAQLAKLGLFDAALNIDTPLFIDPLLLEGSGTKLIREDGARLYRERFEQIVKLLSRSKTENDVAWKAARRLLSFPEFRGTCLGYGGKSTAGSGFGKGLTDKILKTAKEIIDLGVEDPSLFVALALFEDEVAADRISDMATRVVMPALLKLNEDVARALGLKTSPFTFGDATFQLLPNPFTPQIPVVLVPKDILRDLPIAGDWAGIKAAVSLNDDLRQRVNKQIGDIWRISREAKAEVREAVTRNKAAFEALLDAIREAAATGYDFERDERGILAWQDLCERLLVEPSATKFKKPLKNDDQGLLDTVNQIVEDFRFLVEDRDLWKNLWSGSKARPEKNAQLLFYVAAYAYCRANDIDITPEADTGSGPVDFKFSTGWARRHLVEMKLSTNKAVLRGYSKQLAQYKKGEQALQASYVVIDVGSMGKKRESLLALQAQAREKGDPVAALFFIDGTRQRSASKA